MKNNEEKKQNLNNYLSYIAVLKILPPNLLDIKHQIFFLVSQGRP